MARTVMMEDGTVVQLPDETPPQTPDITGDDSYNPFTEARRSLATPSMGPAAMGLNAVQPPAYEDLPNFGPPTNKNILKQSLLSMIPVFGPARLGAMQSARAEAAGRNVRRLEEYKQRMGMAKTAETVQGAFDRAALKNEVDRQRLEVDRMKAEAQAREASRRTDAYIANIDSLSQARADQAALGLQTLQERIRFDTGLTDYHRAQLETALKIAGMNISQRQSEDANRMLRLQTAQEAINKRQKEWIDKGFMPLQVANTALKAHQYAASMPEYGNMLIEDQAELENGILDALMQGRVPTIKTETGKSKGMVKSALESLFPSLQPTIPKVEPGRAAPQRGPAAPATAVAPPPTPSGKRVKVSGQDGTGEFTLPEEQIDAYLKKYPKAKRL